MKVRILFFAVSFFVLAGSTMAQSPLALQSIQPSGVFAGAGATQVTLTGGGFSSSLAVTIADYAHSQFQSLTPVVIDSTTMQVTIPASVLTAPDALAISVGTAPNLVQQLFYVYSTSAPTVTAINPAGGLAGTTQMVSLTGTNLIGASLTFSSGGITAVTMVSSNPVQGEFPIATIQVTVAPGTPLGTQTVTVSTPAGSTASCGPRPCTFSIVGPGVWTDVSTSSLPVPAGVTRLLDGRILVVGYYPGPNGTISNVQSNAQIFDPVTNLWTNTAAPATPRTLNTSAVLLPDGRVFVSSSSTPTPEIYDPATGSWAPSPVTTPASGGAILLANGQLLMEGGLLIDPLSGASQTITLPNGTMQLEADGKVLIVGGSSIYDPATGTITAVPLLNAAAEFNVPYKTSLLPDGRVLIQTGMQAYQTVVSSGAIYDPATNTLLPSQAPSGGAQIRGTVLLPSGQVLVSGVAAYGRIGLNVGILPSVVLYDPQTDQTVTLANGNPPVAPDVLLEDGRTFGISNFSVLDYPALTGVSAAVYSPSPNAIPTPVIGSVASRNGASAGLTVLDIRGTSFVPNSIVELGGWRLVTLYLGAEHLAAFVPAPVSSSLSAGVTVTNPGLAGNSTAPVPVGFVQTLPISAVETGTIRTGYAILTPDFGTAAPVSTLTYGIVQNAMVESQAAILPTGLTTATSLPVDYIPTVGRNLGIAIANPNAGAASITLTLRDPQGNVAASPVVLSIAPGNQIARFVSELFPAGALGTSFTGNVTLQSSMAVSIIGLRFSGQVFSTVPVTGTLSVPPQGSTGGLNAVMFPQFAMSGNWATTFALLNPTNSVITGRLDLFDPGGNPLVVTLNNTTASTFTYSIPAQGNLTFAPRDPSGLSPF